MGEDLSDILAQGAHALHWLGHYQLSNACTLLSRLLRAKNITTLDKLEEYVGAEESAAAWE